MPNDAVVQVRVDPKVKTKAEKIFNRLGMSTSDAVRIFLAQTIEEKGLPFQSRIPNTDSRKAIAEARTGKLKKTSLAELEKVWNEA